MSCSITAIVMTYNEELNIIECIESLKQITDKIYVVDSYSNDLTVELAKEHGAVVLQNEFKYQAQQFKFAMNNIKIDSKWVIRLDADERLSSEAAEELNQLLETHDNDNINGIVLRFDVSFLGRKLYHGGVYPFQKMSVYRQGYADIEDKEMDEHFYLLSGSSVIMKSDCHHCDYKDISSWIDKHNKYSTREANGYLYSAKDISKLDEIARKKQKNKIGIYYKAPIFLRAKLLYLYKIIVKMAWLDGREGLIYAFLHAYWYRYLVDVKIYENKHNSNSPKS